MSSVECLREFVNERLTAAAEEIFGVFKRTMVEYEQEIDRQRRLLDIVWKPHVKLQRIELSRQHVCKEEEVFDDQQFCNQERISNLDKEPPEIKEEQEELCIGQEGEQLLLNHQTDILILTSYEENDHSEPEVKINHQLLSPNSHVAENQDPQGRKHEESGSTWCAKPKNRLCKSRSHIPKLSKFHLNPHTGKQSFKCDKRVGALENKSRLQTHSSVNTGKGAHTCKTCGKIFSYMSVLRTHRRIHTDERRYSCSTCGKTFIRSSHLKSHMRIHTGERPFICKTCGKSFRYSGDLTIHTRRAHTGENPHICTICGKRYFVAAHLARHMKSHACK